MKDAGSFSLASPRRGGLLAVAVAAAAWVGCGGGDSPSDVEWNPDNAVRSVELAGSLPATVLPGGIVEVAVRVLGGVGLDPVAGATVRFAPAQGSGSASPTVANTDGQGIARTQWTVGTQDGGQTMTASVGAVSVTAAVRVLPVSPDRDVLEALYRATGGPNWTDNTNWLTDAPLAAWYGVTTDATGRVTGLDLAGYWDSEGREFVRHGLNGPIPLELGDLTNLEFLDLRINNLTGSIPSELGNLTNLGSLWLSTNDLTGSIPSELGSLTNLWLLVLSRNDLTGSIPSELGKLTNLESLGLSINDLTGSIPSELGNLTNLWLLELFGNDLTGSIPSELGSLTNLESLDLSGNDLTGSIPSELGSLTNLAQSLNLGINNLTDSIPPELGNLTNLYSLGLGWNDLTGSIPSELGNLTNLEYLGLSINDLTGSIPSELGNLVALRGFFVDSNPGLAGPLPLSLTNLGALVHFQFYETNLCVPNNASFVAWLQAINNVTGTNRTCP